MRKGLGCGAVGDTREDLQVVSRSWDIRSLGGYILPQCFTLPIDALKVPVVSPYVVGRSPS